jgi:hypothetical protein
MRVRQNARFFADFPDDMIEEGDRIVQFPGRAVAEAIVTILRLGGYKVSDPQHQEEHGWDFEVTFKYRRIWIQVACLGREEVYLDSVDVFMLAWLLENGGHLHAEVLTHLNEGMLQDPRFTEIRWLSSHVSDEPGEPDPVISDPQKS